MMTFDKRFCFDQIAEGNKKAFDVFFKHYYPKLVQFARMYVNSLQQAEDVVADVLTNLLIHRQRVFALDHFEAYLYSSIKNKSLSSIKRKDRANPYPLEFVDFHPKTPGVADPFDVLIEKELRDEIGRIIHNLPPKRKMVFQLVREEGLSYRQVSQLMEISDRTVEVHLKLAIEALRKGVESYLEKGKAKKVT
jgi:RNA polymerase sigma-70 factor (family 1)